MTSKDRIMPPVHPGEVLMQEYLEPFGITQHHLAVVIGVPPRRINEIVHDKRGNTADTALRFARYFGTSERFWLNLQSRYEIELQRDRLGHVLEEITPLRTAWLGRFWEVRWRRTWSRSGESNPDLRIASSVRNVSVRLAGSQRVS